MAPLAHAALENGKRIEAVAGGLKATIDIQRLPNCAVATLLTELDRSATQPCRMLMLTVRDVAHAEAKPFHMPLAPYDQEGGSLRDVQMDVRRLDPALPLPQLVVSGNTGGAHCCEMVSIIGKNADGAWVYTDTDTDAVSGEGGPAFSDADGDGTAEIVTNDEQFLYVFASHAGSYSPVVISRYRNGKVINVTREKAFRDYLAADLKRSQTFWEEQDHNEPNGFLAYYVATQANMGEFRSAWAYMLAHYDHADTGFGVSRCDLRSDSKGNQDKPCPENDRKTLPFPEGLSGFLVKTGYVTPGEVKALSGPAPAPGTADGVRRYQPDFSCQPPPERNGVAVMLCQNSEVARHELQFDQVYYALRQVVGKDGWDALKQEVVRDQNALNQECGLPVPGTPDQSVPENGPSCYMAGMDRLADSYRGRLSGAALEESRRPLDQHILIQKRLVDLGYLPAGSQVDGVYGEATRQAIETWQNATHQPAVTAFVSDADAARLLKETTSVSGQTAPAAVSAGSGATSGTVPPEAGAVLAPQAPAYSAKATWFHLSFSSFWLTLWMVAVGVSVYFVPFIVACLRDVTRKPVVFAVNVLLGWTLVGWIVALVMALSGERRQR